MYPFNLSQPYPRNRWYIAAFAHELGEKPIQRTLLGTPVALYRTGSGKAVAMYGLCPHRYYPLGLGKVEGDTIVCGYHGFAFNSSGKCTRIPSQGTGAGFSQPTYPLVERGFLIWIWLGDAALADEGLIPPCDEFGLDQPGWVTSGGRHHYLKARVQLLIDNLMDLTHLPHIHGQVDGGEIMLRTRNELFERDQTIRLLQIMEGPWTHWHSALWGHENRIEEQVTSHGITDFYGPELIRVSGPQVVTGTSEKGAPQYLAETYFLHGMTPETDTTTHYWGFQTRNIRIDDAAFSEEIASVDAHIRQQDIDALEAVEKWVEFGAHSQKELLVKADRPAAVVRERMRNLIETEV